MTNIIFAIPRHEYASYRDLYTLIDLSGFQKVFIDEIDEHSDNAYIITILNGEVPEGGYPDARAKIVLWDNEWHLDGVPQLAGVTYWAADKWYAERIGAQYAPMGSHPGLRLRADSLSPEAYDVAFIGYFDGVPRRQLIRQQLIAAGVKVSPGGAWGEERHRILSNSLAYLCVHQLADAPTIAPLRMVVAAAYGLCVITEDVADPGVFRRYVDHASYGQIVQYTREAFDAPGDTMYHAKRGFLHRMGEALQDYLCHDFTFRMSVEAAL